MGDDCTPEARGRRLRRYYIFVRCNMQMDIRLIQAPTDFEYEFKFSLVSVCDNFTSGSLQEETIS